MPKKGGVSFYAVKRGRVVHVGRSLRRKRPPRRRKPFPRIKSGRPKRPSSQRRENLVAVIDDLNLLRPLIRVVPLTLLLAADDFSFETFQHEKKSGNAEDN